MAHLKFYSTLTLNKLYDQIFHKFFPIHTLPKPWKKFLKSFLRFSFEGENSALLNTALSEAGRQHALPARPPALDKTVQNRRLGFKFLPKKVFKSQERAKDNTGEQQNDKGGRGKRKKAVKRIKKSLIRGLTHSV